MSSESLRHRALLRRFEPVVRYTRGELFFPMAVDAYVREASLWVQRPNEEPECLIPEEDLTLEALTYPPSDSFDAVYFLKFIDPMNLGELAAYRFQQVRDELLEGQWRERFRSGRGRLARVGYFSRLLDALFSLSLLTRGRVPGDTAVAAARAYERIRKCDERYVYYGRVLRENGWIVLQYWFFYPFNNWRTGFFGLNDHEADWEMISIFLWEDDEGRLLQPDWVTYASHDYPGDELRRRWDDPTLEKVGSHPVVYAGAGSHAGYYAPGEYLTELEVPFLRPISRFVDGFRKVWWQFLKQQRNGRPRPASELDIFRMPFVDYARGDGLSIGPGQVRGWDEPELLTPPPAWALHYRGLWGLYAHDPASGENAPAGPLYNRDGTMRRTWYDPVGWAGLDAVSPPGAALARLQARRAEVVERRQSLQEEVARKSRDLLHLGIEVQSMWGHPHLKSLYQDRRAAIESLAREVEELRARYAEDTALLEVLDLHAAELEAGKRPPPQTHLKRPPEPVSEMDLRMGRFAETWAAISVGLMMVGVVALFLFARHYLLVGLSIMLVLLLVIEANFQRQLLRLVTGVTIAMAIISALIVFYDFFWEIVVLFVLVAGGYLIVENLRELWG